MRLGLMIILTSPPRRLPQHFGRPLSSLGSDNTWSSDSVSNKDPLWIAKGFALTKILLEIDKARHLGPWFRFLLFSTFTN
jgi:hypothetical protein